MAAVVFFAIGVKRQWEKFCASLLRRDMATP